MALIYFVAGEHNLGNIRTTDRLGQTYFEQQLYCTYPWYTAAVIHDCRTRSTAGINRAIIIIIISSSSSIVIISIIIQST
jgi:hypothetical protein